MDEQNNPVADTAADTAQETAADAGQETTAATAQETAPATEGQAAPAPTAEDRIAALEARVTELESSLGADRQELEDFKGRLHDAGIRLVS